METADQLKLFETPPKSKLQLLSQEDLIAYIEGQADIIHWIPAPQCKNPHEFVTKVRPVMQVRNCFGCHGGGDSNESGSPLAVSAFRMIGSDSELCSEFLERSSPNSPVSSMSIVLPLNGKLMHPPVLPFSRDVIPAWTDWIASEK